MEATSSAWQPFITSMEDAAACLADCELKPITYEPGEKSPLQSDAEDQIIFMRAGRIPWTVENDSLDAEAGDTIVTSAGVEHAFEVLGGKPSQVVCIVCPPAEAQT